jgi:hypothetical protein
MMAIRLRTVEWNGGRIRIAVCAAETDCQPGDIYLDDADHYALAAKFALDWHESDHWGVHYPEQWAAMETQKKRDAQKELERWISTQAH